MSIQSTSSSNVSIFPCSSTKTYQSSDPISFAIWRILASMVVVYLRMRFEAVESTLEHLICPTEQKEDDGCRKYSEIWLYLHLSLKSTRSCCDIRMFDLVLCFFSPGWFCWDYDRMRQHLLYVQTLPAFADVTSGNYEVYRSCIYLAPGVSPASNSGPRIVELSVSKFIMFWEPPWQTVI